MLNLVVILGPTASGKTSLAVKLADLFNTDIISGDSRQIYKNMDIGTGKDLFEYNINNRSIPYHLIDIINPNEDYSIHQFKKDFYNVYDDIIKKNKFPILCGGSGLYIESILLNYKIPNIPPDYELRETLQSKTLDSLKNILNQKDNSLYNSAYHVTKRRIIRSIELFNKKNIKSDTKKYQSINNYKVIGIKTNRDVLLQQIKKRLEERLSNGMVEEVELLIQNGMSLDRLKYFGLEYRFLGEYLFNNISYEEMVNKLNVSINRFSKKQMTFFRRMEKRGIEIKWIKNDELEEAKKYIKTYL
ncbi:MAG: tRNA (adenosine(37)-N6)-dimethylallyltransferase MiaA [Candidatus Marinimicrobia bacterium]|nr:tRNA (adenosine(37)-N6)-dimethylallyltransferase MiaA [Candidatus Neomarinimicrobiota bacterium]|tara:strand:+ start:30304 stop:31209 length:906 start_codon:yes stop_codon:yes gene_type:complete